MVCFDMVMDPSLLICNVFPLDVFFCLSWCQVNNEFSAVTEISQVAIVPTSTSVGRTTLVNGENQ